MKTKLQTGLLVVLGIILIFSVPLVAQDQGEEDHTFRNTRWGMSKSEVIAQEGEPDGKNKNSSGGYETSFVYDGIKVGGLKAHLYYMFTEDKLVRASYLFRESHTNRNKFIEDFEEIKTILTNKYGRPVRDEENWRDDLYKDKPSQHGFAVSIGDLEYLTVWETEETTIWMRLDGDNYEIDHGLYYDSKEFEELVEEKEKEQTESQF